MAETGHESRYVTLGSELLTQASQIKVTTTNTKLKKVTTNIIDVYVAFVLKQLKIWGLYPGNPLAVQWLGLHAFTAVGLGLISDRGTCEARGAARI